MRRLFHGTTKENYQSILENGFNGDLAPSMVWNVSDSSVTYFYDSSKEEFDDQEECIYRCISNAQITASVHKYLGNEIIVMELEVDDELCEDDESCGPAMVDTATVIDNDYLDVSMIKKVYISDDAYSPFLRLYFLSCVNHDYLNKDDITSTELTIVEKLDGTWIDTNDYSWREL